MSFTFECCSANSVDGFQYPYMLITPDIAGVTAKRNHQIFGLVFLCHLIINEIFLKKSCLQYNTSHSPTCKLFIYWPSVCLVCDFYFCEIAIETASKLLSK